MWMKKTLSDQLIEEEDYMAFFASDDVMLWTFPNTLRFFKKFLVSANNTQKRCLAIKRLTNFCNSNSIIIHMFFTINPIKNL